MAKVGGRCCRRRSCCGPQRLLRRRCGDGDEGGGRLQDDNGVDAQVRKMDKIVLCLNVADSIAGKLLLSSLVKDC